MPAVFRVLFLAHLRELKALTMLIAVIVICVVSIQGYVTTKKFCINIYSCLHTSFSFNTSFSSHTSITGAWSEYIVFYLQWNPC